MRCKCTSSTNKDILLLNSSDKDSFKRFYFYFSMAILGILEQGNGFTDNTSNDVTMMFDDICCCLANHNALMWVLCSLNDFEMHLFNLELCSFGALMQMCRRCIGWPSFSPATEKR